jgi:hypothetical protein
MGDESEKFANATAIDTELRIADELNRHARGERERADLMSGRSRGFSVLGALFNTTGGGVEHDGDTGTTTSSDGNNSDDDNSGRGGSNSRRNSVLGKSSNTTPISATLPPLNAKVGISSPDVYARLNEDNEYLISSWSYDAAKILQVAKASPSTTTTTTSTPTLSGLTTPRLTRLDLTEESDPLFIVRSTEKELDEIFSKRGGGEMATSNRQRNNTRERKNTNNEDVDDNDDNEEDTEAFDKKSQRVSTTTSSSSSSPLKSRRLGSRASSYRDDRRRSRSRTASSKSSSASSDASSDDNNDNEEDRRGGASSSFPRSSRTSSYLSASVTDLLFSAVALAFLLWTPGLFVLPTESNQPWSAWKSKASLAYPSSSLVRSFSHIPACV